MLKLLLLVGVLVGVYYLFFKKKKSLTPPSSDNSQEEAMIPCAHCGTYVQVKETFMRDGKYYYSVILMFHHCRFTTLTRLRRCGTPPQIQSLPSFLPLKISILSNTFAKTASVSDFTSKLLLMPLSAKIWGLLI